MDQTNSRATKIMIIRHAEKPNTGAKGVTSKEELDKESLIVRGWQRAGALAAFFVPANGQFQNPGIATPRFVYASKVAKNSKSQRPQETVKPMIHKLQKLGNAVQENYDHPKGEEQIVGADALTCHGVVLICWEHTHIPAIASQILPISAEPPDTWPNDRFDVVWIFDLNSTTGKYTFSQVPQLLLAGDGLI